MNIVQRIVLNMIYPRSAEDECALLRSGILPLSGMEEETLICSLYISDIGNEFHFVFYWPNIVVFYWEPRNTLFSNYNINKQKEIDFLKHR